MHALALVLSLAGPPAAPPPAPVSTEAVRKAVAKSLPPLWTGVQGHSDSRSCFTCHNHAVPLLAFATARGRGFGVPEKDLNELIEFVSDDVGKQRDRFLRGQGPGPPPAGGEADNTGYMLFALEAAGRGPDETTDALVEYTLQRDRHRDYWWTPAPRPPSEGSSVTTTALSVRGLARFARADRRERAETRIAAARGWLLRTTPRDTEDRVFRLIGLKAAGADAADVAKATKDLLSTQRTDGGWGQLDSLDSDAYATGSALYALHTCGGLPTDDPAYRRGLGFLVTTQRGDGSWHVRTRSRPVQRYFETGFPYEKGQFISCAATGWAATALALACPPAK